MQDPDMADETGGGYSVTITSNGDGTYSVSSSDQDEAQDTQAGGEPSGPQSAQTIEEALNIADQMLQEEATEDNAEAPEEGEDPNAPLPSKSAAQDVWNQMASSKDKQRGA